MRTVSWSRRTQRTFDGGLCGVGAKVLFDRIVEDDSKTDAFGDHPRMRVAKCLCSPLRAMPCK